MERKTGDVIAPDDPALTQGVLKEKLINHLYERPEDFIGVLFAVQPTSREPTFVVAAFYGLCLPPDTPETLRTRWHYKLKDKSSTMITVLPGHSEITRVRMLQPNYKMGLNVDSSIGLSDFCARDFLDYSKFQNKFVAIFLGTDDHYKIGMFSFKTDKYSAWKIHEEGMWQKVAKGEQVMYIKKLAFITY